MICERKDNKLIGTKFCQQYSPRVVIVENKVIVIPQQQGNEKKKDEQ